MPWPHVWAALAGAAIPQIGTMVRARWAHLLPVASERHTAFAAESVFDEVVFVTGPALVTFLATAFAPQAGLVAAVTVGTVGTLGLAVQRRTEPPAHPRDPTTAARPDAVGSARAADGRRDRAGQPVRRPRGRDRRVRRRRRPQGVLRPDARRVLARQPRRRRRRRHDRLEARPARARPDRHRRCSRVGTLALPFLPDLAVATVALFVTGMALAPTLITLFSLIEASVPRSRLNEAMGFVQTGMSGGIAPGAWLAGLVADGSSGSAAYWVCTVSAALAALAAVFIRSAEALASGHGDMDQLVAAQHRPPDAGGLAPRRGRGRRRRGGRAAPEPHREDARHRALVHRHRAHRRAAAAAGRPARHRRRRPGRDDRDRPGRYDARRAEQLPWRSSA